jgi:hypothetical protein
MDHDIGFALSGSLPLNHGFGLAGEGYGYTRLNEQAPAFASTMFGITYQINPRLVLDTGLDIGVTHDAPKRRVYIGITYAITNLFGRFSRGR